MSVFDYDRTHPHQFGGLLPEPRSFDESASVILPIPFERTTSYHHGTMHGPRELLVASAQVELWDEELGVDVHPHGMFTAPELDLSALTLEGAMGEIGRVAGHMLETGKFLITLGGEHSITSPIVGVSRAEQLEELIRNATFEITPEQRDQLSAIFDSEVKEEALGAFAAWRRRSDVVAT